LPELHQLLFPADSIQWAMLDTVAWLGVLFLLLDTGLEVDFSIAWRRRGNALIVAVSDIILPILIVFAIFIWMPDRYFAKPEQRWLVSLFVATVLTISELPATARVLSDLRLLKSEMGYLILSALTANDIIGWVLFTILLGMFTTTQVALGPIALVVAGTIGFAALAMSLGRYLSIKGFAYLKTRNLPEPGTSLTITVLLGLLFGCITQWMGIHALFGFFLAGIVVGEAKAVSEQTRNVISQMVHTLFVPIFFTTIGLKVDFLGGFDLLAFLVVFIAGTGGRYLGAWFGVTLSSIPRMNRDLISIAHTPGGIMQIVIAVLAMESGIITNGIFVAIVFGAILSAMLMGPWMSHSFAKRGTVKVASFLCPGALLPNLKATDCNGAIRELTCALQSAGVIKNCDALIDQLLTREAEYGTALGSNIAIPHARVEALKEPLLTVGKSLEGIEWNAPDGQHVHLVFLLLTPVGTEDIHVQTLATIARCMTKRENVHLLQTTTTARELETALRACL
jgi:Kef-type K+ transport system membrane component KefB